MATLRAVSIQPLDLILFRGMDPVSKAICFMEAKEARARGFLTHRHGRHAGSVGFAIPRAGQGLRLGIDAQRAPAGFWARFTDKVPDVETKGLRFGVQLRDLELVVEGYSSNGGKVAWCAYRGPRPPMEDVVDISSICMRSTDTRPTR